VNKGIAIHLPSAHLSFHFFAIPSREKRQTFAAIAGEFEAAHEMRSDLAHSFISPFDPEVKERASSFTLLARRALCCALGLFGQCKLFAQPESDADFTLGSIGWPRNPKRLTLIAVASAKPANTASAKRFS
jgi:hypothetical protein